MLGARIRFLMLGSVLFLCTFARATERPCEDLYFGYAGAPDYEAAYACLDAERERAATVLLSPTRDGLSLYGPLILMRLNGRGVEVDLPEASALLAEWGAAEPSPSKQQLYLKRVILERRSGLGGGDAGLLELCDLPGGASFEARCAEIERRREESQQASDMHGHLGRIPEAARPKLQAVIFAFRGYADREAERVERAATLDDDADARVASQRARAQSNFDIVVREALLEASMPAATAVEASRAERAVERRYAEDRRQVEAEFEAYEKALPESADEYERYRRRYETSATQTQAAWKRYRDAWVDVVRAASDDPNEAEASLRVLLAEQRVGELRPE